MGCEVSQADERTIFLTQRNRLDEIDEKCLEVGMNKTGRTSDRPVTAKERNAYPCTLGQMLFVGRLSQPIMLFQASNMA